METGLPDVLNPLASSADANIPMAAASDPLAPGTTPASLSVSATPNNPVGQRVPVGPALQSPTGGISALTGQPKQPTAPGGPAKGSFGSKLLQAIGGVLSGLSDVGSAAVAGAENPAGVQARADAQKKFAIEQQAKEKERQDKLTQQNTANQREDDEAHARIAESNARLHAIQTAAYRGDEDYMDNKIKQGQHDLQTMESAEVPAQVLQRGLDEGQMNALLQQGKINGYEYTAIPTGTKPAGTDAQGNPVRAFTYDIVKVPDTWKPTADQIARIKTVPGYEKFQEGTIVSGAQLLSALSQADAIKATHDAMNAARRKSDLDELTAEQQDNLASFNKSGDFLRFLNTYGGNPVSAATHMLTDPNMAKKYSTGLYNDIMGQFADKNDPSGTENFEKMRHNLADEANKAAEDKLKKASEHGYEGDSTLTGDAFLKSLQPNEAPLVKAAGDGRMNISNLGYLISRNPGFADAVALYDPSFDSSKVDGYVKANKDFTSGQTSKALNSGATAIQTLRRLYDNTNTESLLPGSDANKKRQADLETAAIEVAKFQAGGTQPGKDDIAAAKALLDPTVPLTGGLVANPINRKAAVKEQLELVQNKLNNYEQQWTNAAPSPRYQAAMPGISNAAKIDASYVLNDGKYAVPRGAQGFVDPKTNHQIFSFDGKTWYDSSNGQPVKQAAPASAGVK